MNLRIFFDPIKETLIPDKEEATLFCNNITLYVSEFPSLEELNIAIIGIDESRGSVHNTVKKDSDGNFHPADHVRKKLYPLKKGSFPYKVADLGNLRIGVTLEETYLRLTEVCSVLMAHNVIPVIIGGSHDLDYAQFMGYENSEKLITFLNVDAFIDMNGSSADMSKHHIHKILVHESNILFNYSHLAYQTYLTDQETLSVLEKLYFETIRIGELRKNLEEAEPVIRDADLMSFDITSIRQTDAPGNKNSQPFGLTGEEACQLCWYAGLSSKLSSIGFYEYNPEEDHKLQTAGVIATMLWYFIEGFYHRKEDSNLSSSQYTKYIVTLTEEPHKLVFYKNMLTEKWWMEVPYPAGKEKFARNSIVPCSYSDYQAANNGEIPNRWIMTHAKLI